MKAGVVTWATVAVDVGVGVGVGGGRDALVDVIACSLAGAGGAVLTTIAVVTGCGWVAAGTAAVGVGVEAIGVAG